MEEPLASRPLCCGTIVKMLCCAPSQRGLSIDKFSSRFPSFTQLTSWSTSLPELEPSNFPQNTCVPTGTNLSLKWNISPGITRKMHVNCPLCCFSWISPCWTKSANLKIGIQACGLLWLHNHIYHIAENFRRRKHSWILGFKSHPWKFSPRNLSVPYSPMLCFSILRKFSPWNGHSHRSAKVFALKSFLPYSNSISYILVVTLFANTASSTAIIYLLQQLVQDAESFAWECFVLYSVLPSLLSLITFYTWWYYLIVGIFEQSNFRGIADDCLIVKIKPMK